mgnify:CR=1 FL=1
MTMYRFTEGDRVRIDISDTTDPDHEPFHGNHGVVATILTNDTGASADNERGNVLYHDELDDGREMDFRLQDL